MTASCRYGKPVLLDGFGLVSQANSPYFVPFNSSETPSNSSSVTSTLQLEPIAGVTNDQQADAYYQWFQGTLAHLA